MKNDSNHTGSTWKKFLKIFGTSTLAIAMALSLTGCGTATSTAPTQIVVWGFVDEDVFTPIIRDFKNSHKGIDVKYYKKDLDANYEDNALNSILSGQGPDVWAIPNDWVYRHKDKLAPTPDSLLTSAKLVPKDFFNSFVMSDCAFDNKMYAMPGSTDSLRVYYNQQLLTQADDKIGNALRDDTDARSSLSRIISSLPATWEEFDKIIPWLTVKNGSQIQTAGAAIGTSNNVSYSQDILSLLMIQNSTKMLSDDLSQATFNLPVKNSSGVDTFPGKTALDFYTKYSNPGSAQYTWNAGMPNDIEAFVQGKVAIIFGYSGLAGHLNQVYPNFRFQTGLMPQVGNLNPIIDYAHYTTYTVPKESVAVSTAWSFIINNLATDQSGTYVAATKELPVSKTSDQTQPSLQSRTEVNTPGPQILSTMQSWNKGRYPVDLDNQLKDAINRVNARSQSSQASLDTAASNITELLRKKTW